MYLMIFFWVFLSFLFLTRQKDKPFFIQAWLFLDLSLYMKGEKKEYVKNKNVTKEENDVFWKIKEP
jgi:hypothetical protein